MRVDRFCLRRKRGTGRGRWAHPKGENSMAPCLVLDLKSLGTAISLVLHINGPTKWSSHIVWPFSSSIQS